MQDGRAAVIVGESRARRPRGWSRVLAGTFAALLVTAAAVTGGCGATTDLSPMMDAYQRAHPDYVDGPLTPTDVTLDEVFSRIREGLDPAVDVWLPGYLPAGFRLAAPYNGDGSGSAYPNPYVWGRGYGVTYTDGSGYVMVLAGSDDDLSGGEWVPLSETVGGRHLRLQRVSGMVLVATVEDGGLPLLVSGGGLAADRLATELVRVAESLALR